MKQKLTMLTAMLIIICSASRSQSPVLNKLQGLPSFVKELAQGPPPLQMMQTDPKLYQRLMLRRATFTSMLQKAVQTGQLPKEALDVLNEKSNATVTAAPKTAGPLTTDFHLTKDINTSTDASPYNYNYNFTSGFAVLNNVIYYQANDGINGVELWRSDGTAAGTYMVADIAAGSTSSQPLYITVFNGKVYFSAYETLTGWQLYQSNGTAAGTALLKDFTATGSTYPERLTVANGSLYFTATGGSSYRSQLWKSDGTTLGTVLVSDIYSSSSANNIGQFMAANGLLFFTAWNQSYGRELWRSDGTSGGTYLIKDINQNNNNNFYDDNVSGPANLTAYNGKLYFSMTDGFSRVLYQSDGTNAGTTPASFNNGVTIAKTSYSVYQDQPFAIAQSSIFFAGSTSATGAELYKYNASNSVGAVLVKDIAPGTISSVLVTEAIRSMNDSIYFVTPDFSGTVYSLWKSGGTVASTNALKTVSGNVNSFYAIGKKLYFSPTSDANGSEPWVSDGTAAGTKLLKDINTGTYSSNPDLFTLCNGKVYFRAFTLANGSELWNTTGTAASTLLIKDVNTIATSSSVDSYNYLVGTALDSSKIVFRATTPATGSEVWISDGIAAGTSLIVELAAGEASNYPQFYGAKNGKAYFSGFDDLSGQSNGQYGTESIFVTDGTAAGTKRIGASNGAIYTGAAADDGTFFYIGYNLNSGKNELWRTDINGNSYLLNGNIGYSLGVAGNLCFFTSANAYGTELWVSNGTVKGTKMIADINPGSGSSNPGNFQTLGSKIIFSASDAAYNNFIYASDGTTTGTVLLKPINPALYNGACVSKSKLYFNAYDAVNGNELWNTDGTAAGTALVKDIYTGTNSSSPSLLTDVNGVVYFMANDGLNGNELWKTTGTNAGTKLVKDITTGTGSSSLVANFTSAGGKLYFTDTSLLWVSNGTTAGTKKVADAGLANVTSIGYMMGTGNKLFISGTSPAYGYEMYEGNATLSKPGFEKLEMAKAETSTGFTTLVFPNPAKNNTTISIANADGTAMITVTDMQGGQLFQAKTSANKITIDISRFAAGTYMVIVKDDKETKTMKLVKE